MNNEELIKEIETLKKENENLKNELVFQDNELYKYQYISLFCNIDYGVFYGYV